MDTSFRFSSQDTERLLAAIGRRDASALHLVDDIETCFSAYLASSRSADGLVVQTRAEVDRVVDSARELLAALYDLTPDVRRLLDLHVLSMQAAERISSDIARIQAPLEDLSLVLRTALADLRAVDAAQRLLAALAQCYRNRLNRNPASSDGGHYGDVLRSALAMAARQEPVFAAVAADSERVRASLPSTDAGERHA